MKARARTFALFFTFASLVACGATSSAPSTHADSTVGTCGAACTRVCDQHCASSVAHCEATCDAQTPLDMGSTTKQISLSRDSSMGCRRDCESQDQTCQRRCEAECRPCEPAPAPAPVSSGATALRHGPPHV